ncbi:hypothetical protein [Sphingomonas sp. Leaf23]|uniref:hypothetical protein n=1 Tax=Sphingomonas sp. Leaf23 TaxID=1735689 RepID=UPI0009E996D5|nr:hypothetical protein [Sphingomonas sp. Leaf23]
MTDWPFADPPDVAVFTTRAIVEDGAWIASVLHDVEDGAWQFHDAGPESADMAEARAVSLRNIVERDPAMRDILDLPLGGYASRGARPAVHGTGTGADHDRAY